jgi:hypothetical protein
MRMTVPPPQLLEHVPHAVQSVNVQPASQSTAALHTVLSSSGTFAHAATVFSRPGGSVRRTRVRVPGPQLESHMDQSLHSETGHGSATVGAGHAATALPHDLCEYTHDGWRRKFGPYRHSYSVTNVYAGWAPRMTPRISDMSEMDCTTTTFARC